MATFTADPGLIKQPRFLHEGMVHAFASYSASATLATADIIQMIQVPKGAVVHDVIVECDMAGLTVTGTLIMSVGDGDDSSRYLSGSAPSTVVILSNKPIAKPIFRMTGAPGYQYSADDTIDITMGGPDATDDAATASMILKLSVTYSSSSADDEGLAGGT